MSRNSSKHSFIGRNYNAPVAGLSSHRRIMSFTNTTTTTEDFSNNKSSSLDLFSRTRRTLSVVSSDESDWQVRMDRLSDESTKPANRISDDLLSSNDEGKHDYDWLLTLPESQPKSAPTKGNSSIRSSSTNRTSRSSSMTQNSNRNSNIQNTNSASVSSYTRPSTPTKRSPLTARPSTASSRTTPSRSRQSTTTTTATTPINRAIRPSTPNVQPTSRSSTPTRKNPSSFNNRIMGPTSRPNSPIVRAPPQLINHPDFPNETPPNLITSVPDRPVSAGRSRPGAPMTVKGNVNGVAKGRLHANVHMVESVTRKPVKVLNSENGTGFGRSISKKSFDMAIKHMDIRTGGTRPLSGSIRFPQSIRPSHGSSAINNVNSNNGSYKNGYSVKPTNIDHKNPYLSKLTRVDAYESLRYDSILLKEDLKNASWLHSADEKYDQSLLFDNGFESLPEPFAPL